MDPKPGLLSDTELNSGTPPVPDKPIILAIVNQVMHYLGSHPDKISFEEKKECAATLTRYKKFLYVLNNVIDAIVKKSIETPNFGPWAALFCLYLSEEDKVGEIFYQLLAEKCEKEVKQLCKIPFQSLDDVQFRSLLYFYAELLCSESNTLGGKWKMVIGEAVYDMLGVLLDSLNVDGRVENFQCVDDVVRRTVDSMTTRDESKVGREFCKKVMRKLENVLSYSREKIESERNEAKKNKKEDIKGARCGKWMVLDEYLESDDEITTDVADALLDEIIVEQNEDKIKLLKMMKEMEAFKEKMEEEEFNH